MSPKDSWALQNLALNYQMQRDFKKATEVIDRALKINQKSPSIWEIKSRIAIEERGDFSVAEAAIAALQRSPDNGAKPYLLCVARGSLFILQRKYAEAAKLAEDTPDKILSPQEGALAVKYVSARPGAPRAE